MNCCHNKKDDAEKDSVESNEQEVNVEQNKSIPNEKDEVLNPWVETTEKSGGCCK